MTTKKDTKPIKESFIESLSDAIDQTLEALPDRELRHPRGEDPLSIDVPLAKLHACLIEALSTAKETELTQKRLPSSQRSFF